MAAKFLVKSERVVGWGRSVSRARASSGLWRRG